MNMDTRASSGKVRGGRRNQPKDFSYFLKAQSSKLEAGFTLVEMIVAIALFAVVMLVAVGALLSLTGANRKAQALQSVMNNLNISLDGMVRNVRMGTNYHCGSGSFQGNGSDDCATGTNTTFSFKPNPLVSAGSSLWTYSLGCTGTITAGVCSSGGYIQRAKDAGTPEQITAPEVSVDSMNFYVVGSQPGDGNYLQPKVIMVLKGTAGAGSGKTKTTFHIEATAVQRELDLAQ